MIEGGTMSQAAPSQSPSTRPYFRTETDGHEVVEHEALLVALQCTARDEQRAERLRALQAIRYVRQHAEGLVAWNFDIRGVERKDIIDWARGKVQKYFVKVS